MTQTNMKKHRRNIEIEIAYLEVKAIMSAVNTITKLLSVTGVVLSFYGFGV